MELEKLQKIIAEVLNVDAQEVTMDTTFVEDLGADSLDIFQIIMGIEEEFDIEMPNEDVEHIVQEMQQKKLKKLQDNQKSQMSSKGKNSDEDI